jgi:hypothetical protein
MPLLASLLFMILNKLIDAGRSSTTQKTTRTDCKLRQQDGSIFGQDVCTFQPLLEVCCPGSTGLVFTSRNFCTARAVLESNVRTAPTKTRTAAPPSARGRNASPASVRRSTSPLSARGRSTSPASERGRSTSTPSA